MQSVKLWGCVSVRGEWTRLAALSCRSLTPTFHSSRPGLSATLFIYCAIAVLGAFVPRVSSPVLVPALAHFDSLPMIDPAMLFVLGT